MTRKPVIERFNDKVFYSPCGCWYWTAYIDRDGYGRLLIERISMLAHRVSWMIVNGPIPDGMQICHHCDNRACVNPHHLFIGTADDNFQDMRRKGREKHAKGSAHGRAKLSDSDVAFIRQSKGSITQRELSKRFGVHLSTITSIHQNLKWQQH